MDALIGRTIVAMVEPTEEKEIINTSIIMQLLGNEDMMGRMRRRCSCLHLSKDFRSHIYSAAKEMDEKIKARKRRDVLVNKFEHSDEEALRVFASQLDWVKY